jgi:hypothetical protein
MTTFKALQKISVAVVLVVLACSAAPAFAAEPEVPWWHVNAYSRPSNLKPGGDGERGGGGDESR